MFKKDCVPTEEVQQPIQSGWLSATFNCEVPRRLRPVDEAIRDLKLCCHLDATR
jgi:hypothetical protein